MMSRKKLSNDDKQWLKDHPEFHVVGDSFIGKARKHIRRKQSEMNKDPTFTEKLDDFDAMNSMIEEE